MGKKHNNNVVEAIGEHEKKKRKKKLKKAVRRIVCGVFGGALLLGAGYFLGVAGIFSLGNGVAEQILVEVLLNLCRYVGFAHSARNRVQNKNNGFLHRQSANH